MRVEPIREEQHVKAIKKLLKDNPRDRLLFILGINSGLRVQTILTELRVKHLLYAKLGDSITVKERKTGKTNVFVVNKEIKKAFDEYYIDAKPDEDHFLFRSRKGKNYPLTTFRVTRLVKEWGAMIGLKQNLGAHSLRKTFCWFQRTKYGTSWEILSHRLNHSSPSITRCYLGITDECVEEILHHTI